MRLGKNKAFSLTELLIVLVIVAMLFAALAPIITKRHISETSESESIWNFLSNDSTRNSYFDPGVNTWTSSLYVGKAPTSANNNSGKVVIDSGDISYNNAANDSVTYAQPQMQFRFSANTNQQGRGLNSANLLVTATNVIFGIDPSLLSGDNNTIYGMSNLNGVTKANNITAFGSQALKNAQIVQNEEQHYITAIGHSAGYNLGSSNSEKTVSATFIGFSAGAGSSDSSDAPDANIAIGYQSMANEGTKGSHNVFIGAYTGNGFTDSSSSYNTIVGSSFSGTKAKNNTIIGYGAYTRGNYDSSNDTTSEINNMTAIGYGACNSIESSKDGSRVCIGYNSAYRTNNTPDSFHTDSGEHIFLGGTPLSEFSGRSILEIHNNTKENIPNATSAANVVINSNLVVRGNFYPSDDNGNIQYNNFSDTMTIGAERAYYQCNDDTYTNVLSYSSFVCKGLAAATPKSRNVLVKGGSCSTSGGYTNGGGCPAIYSDISLKTNITENNDGLDKILELTPYNFTYKSDKDSTPEVGVIAQDLQKVFPNSVSKDENGFLRIRWDEMFYALINSIKELNAKIEVLSNKISSAIEDINLIGNKQKNLQKQISELNKRVNKLERK